MFRAGSGFYNFSKNSESRFSYRRGHSPETFKTGSKNTLGYKIAGTGNQAHCPSLFQSAKMAVIGAWLTLKLIMRGRLEIIILAQLCSMESYIFSEENLSQALPDQFPTWTWIQSLIKMRFRSKKQLERPLMSFQ